MALTKWQPPIIRSHNDEGRVGWLELYFDLIYVAALIQLGDQLADDVSFSGVVTFGAVFTVLWWTWTGTTTFMNRFAVDDVVHRMLIFAQMFAVGNLALVAVSPIDNRSAWMAVAYVAARIPLLIMYVRVRRVDDGRAMSNVILPAFGLGALLWLASLAVEPPFRQWIWAAALLLELAAPYIIRRKATRPVPIHEEHLQERYALFTIIVLGETFVKVLSELAEIGISTTTQVLGGLGFLISIALWWTYFDDVAESTVRTGAGRTITWIYAHLPLTMALTAFGVASKKVVGVETLGAEIKSSYLWLLVSAIALALVATALLDRVTVSPHFAVGDGLRILPRLVAAVLVLLVPLVIGFEPVLLSISVVAAIVAAQIAVEVLVATKIEKRVLGDMETQLGEREGACYHLSDAPLVEPSTAGCERCEELGQAWVQLRVCLTCGHVGCCDDTPGQHARLHYEQTGHALIASMEPGATWAYCYQDDVVAPDWRVSARPA